MMKTKDKSATSSKKCLFVGHLFGQKVCWVYNLETEVFFVSRDVVFHEHIFQFEEVAASKEDSLHEGRDPMLTVFFH